MSTYFTADLHLGHRAVAYARRYGDWPADRSKVSVHDVWWHDSLLAERWDATVASEDTVWVLGDLALSSTGTALKWITERPGTKHLILGNHDLGHPMHSDAHKWQKVYFRAFASVQAFAKRKITLPDGSRQPVLLSHYPYRGDGARHEQDRDTQWRLRNEGLPVLHGHVHTADVITYASPPGVKEVPWAGGLEGRVPQVHVGLDAHDFTPVSLERVTQLLVAEREPARAE